MSDAEIRENPDTTKWRPEQERRHVEEYNSIVEHVEDTIYSIDEYSFGDGIDVSDIRRRLHAVLKRANESNPARRALIRDPRDRITLELLAGVWSLAIAGDHQNSFAVTMALFDFAFHAGVGLPGSGFPCERDLVNA